jgi:hypothetical protein
MVSVGNSGYAVSGKNWVLGGVVGAFLSGLAVAIVNNLFTAAQHSSVIDGWHHGR